MKQVTHLPPIFANILALDIETTFRRVKRKKSGKEEIVANPYQERIVAIAISDGVNSWVLKDNYESVIPLLIDPYNTLVIHNALYDLGFLQHHLGIRTKAKIWDTLLVERLFHAGVQGINHGLADVLARRYGVMLDKAIREEFENHSGPFTEAQLEYIEQDVIHLVRLRNDQLQELGGKIYDPTDPEAVPGMGLIAGLEFALVPAVVDMELTGVSIDEDLWYSYEGPMKDRLRFLENKTAENLAHLWHKTEVVERMEVPTKNGNKLKKSNVKSIQHVLKYVDYIPDIFTWEEWETIPYWDRWIFREDPEWVKEFYEIDFGWHCVLTANLASNTVQVPAILKDLGLKLKSTAEAILQEHLHEHEFIGDLLEYRFWSKTLSWGYPNFINPVTGRIHPSWNQLVKTGRFSCAEPNLQQVPKPPKDPSIPNLRKVFVPRSGYKLIVADYSQQEPRVLAQVSGDPAMIKAANETDIYSAYGIPVYHKEITKDDPERQLLKIAVLADSYGGGAKTLAAALGITENEAWKVKNQLKRAFPVAHQWGDRQLRNLVQKGYMQTLWGRRLFVPEIRQTPADKLWKFGNLARNMPIQGSGADIGKLAVVMLHRYILEMNVPAHIIMLVHDEIVVEVRDDWADEMLLQVQMAMLCAMETICPDVKAGVEAQIKDAWGKV